MHWRRPTTRRCAQESVTLAVELLPGCPNLLPDMSSQLAQYVPVLLLVLVAVGFAVAMLTASVWLGFKSRRNAVKDTAYECGMPAQGDGAARFSVKFSLVAMLFILFDIEVVFLYPWAVVYREMLAENAGLIFGSRVSFIGILFVGYIYALKKKAFDWKSST